ncbi:M48 family metallopeptidase [bacterium]|nr:M48 family metallopeptidase [bacterium]
MKSRHIKLYIISTILTVTTLLIAACATAPITGRKQITIIPEDEILSMSFQQYAQIKKDSELSANQRDTEMLMAVGKRISNAAETLIKEMNLNLKMNWEFVLIKDDKTVNAWCMPGGKVAVYTGILPYTKTEAGLATVIGHEVAHALAQHGNERMSQGLLVQLGGATLSAAMSSRPETTKNLWLQAYGMGTQIGFILPYSRTHEYEADRIGLILMARAGYDPTEAIFFWERMGKSGGQKPPEFLSTHPPDEKRIAAMKDNLPEAMKYYTESQ